MPGIKATGVFAGHLWGDSSIVVTNCFFGACGTTENAGTASEKTEEEFRNGTVAGLLGEAFAQVGDYPKINGPADYSSVDAAIAKANALIKDDYKDFSSVESAINSVVQGKTLAEQAEVDAMAKAIEDAIAALQYKDADYTKVDAAISKAYALKKDDYKDFSAVESAVNAVVRGKNITEQGEVDAMEQAIETALSALQYKDADYTKVDAALAKANALKKDDYKDFSAVETAVNAVARGKNITEQGEVDAMAKAIEDALAALQYKDADYTKVDAAIAKANALNKDNYKDFSAVEAAVNAVVRDKNITEQSEVDAMAKAIEDAIAALEQKPSSGGDDNAPTYAIEVDKDIRNGEVTANRRYAERGDTVTITVTPDKGYTLETLTVTDKNGKEVKLTEKNGKYAFTMPASKVTVTATFMDDNTMLNFFVDVKASDYYYDAVLWAAQNGITSGTDAEHFSPNQPCTRAQIVTFLWRAAGSPEPKSMSSFSDVSADSYYAKAVAWAVENGITTGTGDGKFSPDATCTRAQSVTFLFRAIGKLVDSKAEFSDVLTDSYYANAVAWAVENGVTNGIGDGLFGPNNSCTRAQIVTFLFRAYQGK